MCTVQLRMQGMISRLCKLSLHFSTHPIRARPQKSPFSIIPHPTIHLIIASLPSQAMLQIRFAPHPRRLAHLRRNPEFAIAAVEGTGLMAWVHSYSMMVTMALTMAFRIVLSTRLQMQIRSFIQAGGTLRITASTLGFTSACIIRMAITHTMDI